MLSRLNPTTALVALAVIAAVTLVSVETPIATTVYGVPLVVAFGLALVHCAAIPVAVVAPAVAAPMSIVAALLLQALGSAPPSTSWPWWAVLIVTQTFVLVLVAVGSDWRLATGAWVASVVAPAVLSIVQHPEHADPSSVNLVVFASVSGAGVVLGMVVAQWNEIRAQLLRERSLTVEEYSRRRLAEDRARIARELHDVIAHGLSIINVQSTTAKYRNPGLEPGVEQEFDEIASSSRQALGEMRALLGVLRDSGPSEQAPQPTLVAVPDLVAQAARAGTDVRLDWFDGQDTDDVTEVVGLAAYRIVQEALSNAIRHAPGASVAITGSREGPLIRVAIENTARTSEVATAAGSGFGLVGMRERAASVAGTVTMEGTPGGGFIVQAVLPVRGADQETNLEP